MNNTEAQYMGCLGDRLFEWDFRRGNEKTGASGIGLQTMTELVRFLTGKNSNPDVMRAINWNILM
jgi:hypothetical protein